MTISQTRLKAATFVSIVNLLFFPIYLVLILTNFLLVEPQSIFTLDRFFDLVNLGLFMFIFLSFNKIIKTEFRFYKLEKIIYLLISLKLLGLFLDLFLYFFDNLVFMKYLSSLIVFASSIIYALLGVKLLKLDNSLYGMKKVFSYAVIINGLWFAFLSLSFYCNRLVDYQLISLQVCQKMTMGSALASFLIRFAVYLMLTIIFFRATKKRKPLSV